MSGLLSTSSNSSDVDGEENMDHFKEMSTRVFTILAICSLLGNLIVIFSNHYILDETTRYRMTTSVICGCDLIVKLSYLWGIYILTHSTKEALESTTPQVQACVIQAFVIDFFYICSMVYMACLMIMMTNKYLEYSKQEKTIHKVLHVIPWVIATVVTISTACHGVYGYDRHLNSGSCWLGTSRRISKKFNLKVYYLFAGTLWDNLTQSIVIICYWLMLAKYIHRRRLSPEKRHLSFLDSLKHKSQDSFRRMFGNLILLPFLFITCFMPSVIRIHLNVDFFGLFENADWVREYYKGLYLANGIGNNLTGLVNFALFVLFTKQTRKTCRYVLRQYFGRKPNRDIFLQSKTDSLIITMPSNSSDEEYSTVFPVCTSSICCQRRPYGESVRKRKISDRRRWTYKMPFEPLR